MKIYLDCLKRLRYWFNSFIALTKDKEQNFVIGGVDKEDHWTDQPEISEKKVKKKVLDDFEKGIEI